MSFLNNSRKMVQDISSLRPELTSLRKHFDRRAYQTSLTEAQVKEKWERFNRMMDEWFTLEDLQDNRKLLNNRRIMGLVVLFEIMTPFRSREERIRSMASSVASSMPNGLRSAFPIGERNNNYFDEWEYVFEGLFEKLLLNDDLKIMETMKKRFFSTIKMSIPVKYAEEKILLAGIYQVAGIYWMERKISMSSPRQAKDVAIREFWNVVKHKTYGVVG